MISRINPISGNTVPSDIDRSGLVPRRHIMPNGKTLYYFEDHHVEILKIDILFAAGTALQSKLMQSAAAIQMLTEGTSNHTAQQIAEFMDYRGILLENSNSEACATLTVYSLSRHVADLLPMLHEIITDATYPDEEFTIFVDKRRQKLLTSMQQTSYRARKRYYELLFGKEHPLGRFAVADDLNLLTPDDVRAFHRQQMRLEQATIVLGGDVTDSVLALFDEVFGKTPAIEAPALRLPAPHPQVLGRENISVVGAVQNTLRVGRLLPWRWDDKRYAQFMVLSTVLGGYFGSRLMSNIREEKGYTYGIYAQSQILRDCIAFYIVTDVASDKAEAAMHEIAVEIERLRNETIPDEELEMVRNCMLGDFMRSIDGIFERSERFCQQTVTGVDERFTDNYLAVLEPDAISGETLRQLACEVLVPEEMVWISAGQC